MKRISLLILTAATSALTSFGAGKPEIRLVPLYEGLELTRPISLQIPAGSERRFLVEQTGKIKILPAEGSGGTSKVFFDMTDRMQVEKDFEEGLLGLAFHPQFKENGLFYLSFSRQGPKRLVLAEFSVSKDNPDLVDPESERVLLEVQQPDWNHNSGNVFFGPKDGMLYFCVGDGGTKNGVYLLSQRLTCWNGKVLRIDVNTRTASRPYGIPEDNPFLTTPLACPEIWAWGLRNPWGAAIDPETSQFFLADVGQDLFEEINLIEKGGNYGWNFREASHDFPWRQTLMESLGMKNEVPKDVVLLDPIHEYSRVDGLSITGGYVYRGQKIPALRGHFLYGDWRFGNLWALHYDAKTGAVVNHQIEKPADLSKPTVQPTGFFPDEKGEPLVLDWRGAIFRIAAAE